MFLVSIWKLVPETTQAATTTDTCSSGSEDWACNAATRGDMRFNLYTPTTKTMKDKINGGKIPVASEEKMITELVLFKGEIRMKENSSIWLEPSITSSPKGCVRTGALLPTFWKKNQNIWWAGFIWLTSNGKLRVKMTDMDGLQGLSGSSSKYKGGNNDHHKNDENNGDDHSNGGALCQDPPSESSLQQASLPRVSEFTANGQPSLPERGSRHSPGSNLGHCRRTASPAPNSSWIPHKSEESGRRKRRKT